MTTIERKILAECSKRHRSLANSEPESWRVWGHREWAEQMEHGPPYRPSEWFGAMPDRDLTHYRRTVVSLAERGFLKIWRRWEKQMTNVKLTELGQAEAERLANGDAQDATN